MENFPLNLITFPFWWYTVGASVMWKWSKKHLHYSLQKTGLLVFARHMSEPIYRDYSKSGRILGFFLRLALLFYKMVVFAIKSLFIFATDIAYLLLLPAVIIMIVIQLLPAK